MTVSVTGNMSQIASEKLLHRGWTHTDAEDGQIRTKPELNVIAAVLSRNAFANSKARGKVITFPH
jgi:hypothetical protein